ncbi:unnamed protein product [Microthlaspi erraticum]|uniref:Uncharacterized protein n=1 Tax=Microthlaspi erraticum TaxID=1685480 RepID=A0A6D2KWZ5_9BRAS|nr:unnamed protein product [Microthlaspi erraticum]
MSSPCTKSTTMLSSPWTLWRPSTHMMTHERPWIFEDVELVSRTCIGQVLLLPHGVYKELTCSLEIFWVHYGEGNQVELKEEELQRVWATIADGGTLPQGPRQLRSGAQCLRYVTRLLPTPSLQGKPLGQSMREK